MLVKVKEMVFFDNSICYPGQVLEVPDGYPLGNALVNLDEQVPPDKDADLHTRPEPMALSEMAKSQGGTRSFVDWVGGGTHKRVRRPPAPENESVKGPAAPATTERPSDQEVI